MDPLVVGLIGCGNISDAYFVGAGRSELVRVKACADVRPEAAEAKAVAYGVEAVPVDTLLADPDIEAVINLTVPLAHGPVGLQIVEAGKHLYAEKPLAARFPEGQALLLAAAAKNLRVGCAPDTFLGAAHQAARRAIDAGRIGRPVAGAAAVLSHGMEDWHPNPEFFFKRGGGPIHDIGPYYVTQLVNLLGPVVRVTAQASIGSATRIVTSVPRKGEVIEVEVPTTVNGVLDFASGANVALSASWDVWKHMRVPFEIYGTDGAMLVPDPNFFGGDVLVSEGRGEWRAVDIAAHPFGIPNRTTVRGVDVADYRIIGLLDMAAAIRRGRPHRASGSLALHVLEVLDAFEKSSLEGRHVVIDTPCARPEPLALGVDESVFLGDGDDESA